jgi:hypothetical protein
MSELRRAMEELQQVQQQQGGLQTPSHSVQTPQTPSVRLPQTPQEKNAAAWLAKQKGRKALAAKGSGRVRSVRTVAPLPDADADGQSSEDVASLEGFDYDEQAEKIIATRRLATEHREARVDASSEGLSTLQQARRAGRQDLAIGGAAEHAEWHDAIGLTGESAKSVKPAQGLGRFADGTARSAMILSELLGPPVGQRGS